MGNDRSDNKVCNQYKDLYHLNNYMMGWDSQKMLEERGEFQPSSLRKVIKKEVGIMTKKLMQI